MDVMDKFQHAGLTVKLVYDADCASPLDDDLTPKVVRFQQGYENPSPEFKRMEDVEDYVLETGAVAFGMWGGSWGSQGTTFNILDDENPFMHEDAKHEFFGFVVYPKDLIPQVADGSGNRDVLYRDAVSTIETYEEWCNGECYGVIVENANGDELDSCWGFIGDDYIRQEAERMAEYQSVLEAKRMKTYTALKGINEDGDPDEYEVQAVSMTDALRQLKFDPIKLEVSA